MRRKLPFRTVLVTVIAATGAISCGGDSTSPQVRTPPPAAIDAVAGVSTQTAQVATDVPEVPAVRVTDDAGQPIAGISVRFTVTAGGGSVGSGTAATNAQGVASAGRWTLGTRSGPNALSASVSGLPAKEFTATATPGPAVKLVVHAGSGQIAVVSNPLPNPIIAVARDQYDNPVPGVPVSFQVTSGGGTIENPSQITGPVGLATPGAWRLGPDPGPNTATATSAGLAPAIFTATANPPPPSQFHFTIRYLSTPSARNQLAVDRAVERWRDVITEDLPNVPINLPAGSCGLAKAPALNETVDDLLIFVEIAPIDGQGKVLGTAGPCYIRQPGDQPIVGQLKLDSEDLQMMESTGTLDDVVLHEIGHVLGIGTMWEFKNFLTDKGGADPGYTGAEGLAEYRLLGGTAARVPVENTGGEGTRDGHWRESVFRSELMTGYISGTPNPLSKITIGSLRDLAYGVQLAAGDTYTIGATSAGVAGVVDLGRGEILTRPTARIDRQGRVIPLAE